MEVGNEIRESGTRRGGGVILCVFAGECLMIFPAWLTEFFLFCLKHSWILNQCLPPRALEVSHYLLHVLCSQRRQGQGCACVLWRGGGGVMTQLIIAPLAVCGPIYTGKWEGVRKKKKKLTARQCGSGLGRNYITSKADEFVRCRMLNLPGF